MKKQTYISPAVTICHCATATILAGSEPIKVEIVEGEYEGDFQSKPHDVDLWQTMTKKRRIRIYTGRYKTV